MFINVFIHSSYGICWITQSVQTLSEETPIRRAARGLNWQQINHMPCCTSSTILDFTTCAWIRCQSLNSNVILQNGRLKRKFWSWVCNHSSRCLETPSLPQQIWSFGFTTCQNFHTLTCQGASKSPPAPLPSPSLLPLLSVSFPVQSLNGSLTPFHVKPLTEKKNHDSTENRGLNTPLPESWNEKQIVGRTVRS